MMSQCTNAYSFHRRLLYLSFVFGSISHVTKRSVNSKSRQWRSCFCFHWYTSRVQRFLSSFFFLFCGVYFVLCFFFSSVVCVTASHEFSIFVAFDLFFSLEYNHRFNFMNYSKFFQVFEWGKKIYFSKCSNRKNKDFSFSLHIFH